MNFIRMLCSNRIINVSLLAWAIAQALKVIFVLAGQKKIDVSRFVGSGGMPSSHAALIMSLTTSVGKTCGVSSSEFAIAVVMAAIVMYDASGIRQAAGHQARILNKIIELWGKDDILVEKKLKELLGHTPFEVFVGALLGIVVALSF